MNNSVVITGATGFIGKYLLLNFLSKGYFVCVVIRSEEKKMELAEFLARNNAGLSNITVLCGFILRPRAPLRAPPAVRPSG